MDYDGTKFLGAYMGAAATADEVHLAWALASRPVRVEPYHQTTWTATIMNEVPRANIVERIEQGKKELGL